MTVVVTRDGSRLPVGRKGWPLAGLGMTPSAGSKSIRLLGDVNLSYANLYRQQPWVFIVVNKLARGIARLPLHTFVRQEAEGRERTLDHDVARLFDRPNPRTPPFALKEAIVGSLAIYGQQITWKWRPSPGSPPRELWPIPWQNVRIKGGGDKPIEHYVYEGPLGRFFMQPEDVIHFQWWAVDGVKGTSPLEPLRRTLIMEDAGQRYAISSFSNAARPAGALKPGRQLTDEEKEELRAEIATAYAGPDNAFRIALLENGMDWQPMAHSAQEAEVIEHRKLNREEVAAAYDIPPPIIGILDRATFSNVSEQHRMLYMDTLGPWLTMIEEFIGTQMIATEADAGRWEDVFVEFNLGEVLKGNPRERGEFSQRQFQSSQATPNELRALENRRRIENPLADAVWAPVNMVPISDDPAAVDEWLRLRAAADPAPTAPSEDDARADLVEAVVSELESRGLLSS